METKSRNFFFFGICWPVRNVLFIQHKLTRQRQSTWNMAFGCERYTDRTTERTKRSGPFDLNRGYLSISLASCLLLICTTNPALKIECLSIPFDSIRLAMQRFACSVWLRWYIRTKWIRFFLHRSHDLSAIKKTALNSTRCFFFLLLHSVVVLLFSILRCVFSLRSHSSLEFSCFGLAV